MTRSSRTILPVLDSPLRGETYSAEHLWLHAQHLAERQALARSGTGDRRFIDRFESNCRFIATTYQTIVATARDQQPIAPDAEWLIDNYYVVQEQLREIREDLPRNFYLELPKLASQPFPGLPRVFELAYELIVHTDSSLDEELIAGFISSYQQVTPLTSGEIWAVPIMLRLVLVENLRRLSEHMLASRRCHNQARDILESWKAGKKPELPAAEDPHYAALVTEIVECIRETAQGDEGPGIREVVEQLQQPQERIDECSRSEQQRLAANQVTIGNLITSMRLISALDWSVFFESVSLVEKTLREDPADMYSAMDFATRDRYRHVVEHLAKRTGHDETHVAAAALDAAVRAEQREPFDWRQRHIGYYLVDIGRIALEHEIGYRPKWDERALRCAKRWPTLLYIGGILLFTACMAAAFFACVFAWTEAAWVAVVLTLLALIPASELAIAVANFAVTTAIRPQVLPKLDYSKGIPADHHTLVVMPTMLTSPNSVRNLLERLEIQYLANPSSGLSFALLTDFADADREELASDAELLAIAREGIASLNRQYSDEEQLRFYLLHRRRLWNDATGLWLGWERKRGKLAELNRLLRGATDTSYLIDDETRSALLDVRYVITLDADTRLPHAAASKLVGALAHPLNRPQFDRAAQRVTRGYGVLQPRVSVSLASANQSYYSRIFSNGGGLDPYCTAVSDAYQDFFDEANFTGKGIYDVDAFSAAVEGSFPQNHILSHDLIEGCHARVGAVTDVELFDEYPTKIDADLRRQHRWVRGDWQLLPWLAASVPAEAGRRMNPLNTISKWKIFDNLRRSLEPIAIVGLLVAGWCLVLEAAWLPTAFAIVVLAIPFLLQMLSAAMHWPTGEAWQKHLADIAQRLVRTFTQFVLGIVFLPQRAYYYADAILRTLYRLFVSHRKLLEWETAEATEKQLSQQKGAVWISWLWIPLGSALLAATMSPNVLAWAAPVLALWCVSPWLADVVSRPIKQQKETLTSEDRADLRRIARRTWAFFEAFVSEEDNWLPPDNYQEFPRSKVAHRISPTNEGMYVLSAIAARDFGFISVIDLASALERNLDNWESLDRHRGHPFNWYDTTTRVPLQPRYISTADNGNLSAAFLAAHGGLRDVISAPVFSTELARGVIESVRLVEESLARLQPRGARFVSPALDALESRLAAIRKAATAKVSERFSWHAWASQLAEEAERLTTLVDDVQKALRLQVSEFAVKVRSLKSHVAGIKRDADEFLTWVCYLNIDELPKDGSAEWRHAIGGLLEQTSKSLNLSDIGELASHSSSVLEHLRSIAERTNEQWLSKCAAELQRCGEQAILCRERLRWLMQRYEALALEMDFTLLYNPQRRLFSVGFNLDEGQLDRAHYDLLASEARTASQVAIAKGDADHRHWFQLGRAVTEAGHGLRGLLSWGGTMFEYLMPVLLTEYVPGSLLECSCAAAVERQIAYGRQKRVPWGISESAFAALGANSDYHYQSFGVPGLGLKRGLSKDLVISPYSTALALAVKPSEACANFRYLAQEGSEGPWGFYEAIDYTRDRVPDGERRTVVYAYMAHHQGMTLVALANAMFDQCVQRRFQQQPLIRSTDLLLQERIPVAVLEFEPQEEAASAMPPLIAPPASVSRRITTPHTATPRAHLLSNGQYHVMLTNAGGGYSKFRDLAITRWQADATRDHWGQFVYLRDLSNGRVWSAAYHPTGAKADAYEVTFSIDKAGFRRRDGFLETHLEVAVSPESNVEVRQITLTNHGRCTATIELTSYAEMALTSPVADAAHPAFNKLFVETEYVPELHALIARRRPRDAADSPAYAVHVLAAPPTMLERIEHETDRERFIGRGRTTTSPAALDAGAKLSGATGSVLDAILSLRSQVQVAADESMSLAFVTGFADSHDEAIQLADQFHDPRAIQRTFEMAWARSQVELRYLHATSTSLQLYQQMASPLLYPDAAMRAAAETIIANTRGQSSLWRHGISGDLPIVLLRVSDASQRSMLRDLLLAHEFWHAHGLRIDVVVVNEHSSGYFDCFQEQLLEAIHTTSRLPTFKPGGVYLLRASQLSPDDDLLLEAAASISLHGDRGTLLRQVEAATAPRRPEPTPLRTTRAADTTELAWRADDAARLDFAGQHGGFNDEGNYVFRIHGDDQTPLPWSNVIANPQFGTLITESGGGYTWAGNSRENKLTTWSNDPVVDPPSEIVYIRDEETGAYWTPTPYIRGEGHEFRIVHGRGYSRFETSVTGIESQLSVGIAHNACAKIVNLKLKNASGRKRQLSVTKYVEWVLGVNRQLTQMHICTQRDAMTGALVARNGYHEDYPRQSAFLHVIGGADSITGDRAAFIGRNGSALHPTAMGWRELPGIVGAALDPCGAVQKKIELADGAEQQIVLLIGWTDGAATVADVLASLDSLEQAQRATTQTIEFWSNTCTAIEVRTPNPAFDLIVNHWLLYQTLSCRVWGRSAFYQSGGAFGFRDQLQDVMAVVYCLPHVARQVILQAAARQFEQGDVQHWWHPPAGRGVRTRFADDYLWLPFVVCHYVETTGDLELLDESVPYLHTHILEPHEHERYELPAISGLTEDLFSHCLRAIDHGLRFGAHGLPLIGCGDWNDGMSRVGIEGRGESVWMGWFLSLVLERFAPLVEQRGDPNRAEAYRQQARRVREAVEREAWDGKWYRRAFFDDGTPLGSHENDECTIDSLAQSWSVIAGGDAERSKIAMHSAEEQLVRDAERLVLLLTPPFDKTPLDPGYIKGYAPGIRENGGQYTHAAMWMIQALTLQGRGTRAVELFDLVNPVLTATAHRGEEVYRAEPYVVAADVYSTAPHVGRGGWTWYTGSAAWMYRVAVECILGIQLRGDRLTLQPCIPSKWSDYEVTLRRGDSTWRIRVLNPAGLETGRLTIAVDGEPHHGGSIALFDDGQEHDVLATLQRPNGVHLSGENGAAKVADKRPGR